ncbi:hypothetical protein ACFX2J_015427 [Malus domestica]
MVCWDSVVPLWQRLVGVLHSALLCFAFFVPLWTFLVLLAVALRSSLAYGCPVTSRSELPPHPRLDFAVA